MAVFKKTKKGNGKPTNPSSSKTKRKLLKIGALLCVVIGAVILIYPFLPYLQYQLFPPSSNYTGQDQIIPEEKSFFSFLPLVGKKSTPEDKSGNRLIIPKIGVDTRIVEGQDDRALLRGAWHLPRTSSPEKGGNTVITGHRFRFRPPNNTTFYLLDKVDINDDIVVIWEEKEYRYRVKETKIVNPDQTEILAITEEPTLTLYTCTPLFTIKQRLVVVSELI